MQFATVQPVLARTDLPVITDEEAAALARTTVNLSNDLRGNHRQWMR